MKKVFTFLIVSLFALPSFAQILVSTDFTGYAGLAPTAPAGWFLSWNDTATTSRSFYPMGSTACGATCPTYKFGHDSVYVISPAFAHADSVRFYMKGNGTYKPNKFRLFGGPDTSNWTLIHQWDSVPAAAQIVTYAVDPSYTNLKWYYQKDSSGYNTGFDDVFIFAGAFNGISEPTRFSTSVYPNPTYGIVNIDLGHYSRGMSMTVSNILGKEVKQVTLTSVVAEYALNIADLEAGIYMLRIRSEFGEKIQRVVLKK